MVFLLESVQLRTQLLEGRGDAFEHVRVGLGGGGECWCRRVGHVGIGALCGGRMGAGASKGLSVAVPVIDGLRVGGGRREGSEGRLTHPSRGAEAPGTSCGLGWDVGLVSLRWPPRGGVDYVWSLVR